MLPDLRTLTSEQARRLDGELGATDWAATPPGAERTWHRVPSGELAGWAAGDPGNPRILLVPGVTGSKEDFSLMFPLLVGAGFRVEGIDLAGQNHSAAAGPEHLRPPRRRYDHELFLDDLMTVIDRGTRPVHLLGYSFAGTLAQMVAVRHPELVASLTLLSSPPSSGQAFRATRGVMGPLSRVSSGRMIAGVMLWGIRNNLNRAPAQRYAYVMERLGATRRSSVDDMMRLMRRTPDVAEQVAALDIPKLVAFGHHDLWAPRTHRAYAAAIGAEVAEYATGHSPCETVPHQLSRDMVRLIDTVENTPR